MRIGIELANEHRWPRPSAVAGMARGAEALGYPTLWVRALPGRWLEAVDLLAVAAGATRTIGLGISGATPPLGRVADTVEADLPATRNRLLVALPGAALLADDTNTGRLRNRAKLLATSSPRPRPRQRTPWRCRSMASSPLQATQTSTWLVISSRGAVRRGTISELMVRAPVAAGDAFDDTVDHCSRRDPLRSTRWCCRPTNRASTEPWPCTPPWQSISRTRVSRARSRVERPVPGCALRPHAIPARWRGGCHGPAAP